MPKTLDAFIATAERQSTVQTDRLELELEIAQTERAIEELRREIQKMVDDPDSDLSRLMRKNAQRAEMEAYYKGLTFLARTLDASRRGGEGSNR